ncbi:hypothetical protein Pmani_032245, partial [Petrolisthes manimaculis]
VRLNTLEKEVSWLQHKGKALDQRLSRFLAQKSWFASTLDDLHLRLDSLGRSQKSMTRRDNPQQNQLLQQNDSPSPSILSHPHS